MRFRFSRVRWASPEEFLLEYQTRGAVCFLLLEYLDQLCARWSGELNREFHQGVSSQEPQLLALTIPCRARVVQHVSADQHVAIPELCGHDQWRVDRLPPIAEDHLG